MYASLISGFYKEEKLKTRKKMSKNQNTLYVQILHHCSRKVSLKGRKDGFTKIIKINNLKNKKVKVNDHILKT